MDSTLFYLKKLDRPSLLKTSLYHQMSSRKKKGAKGKQEELNFIKSIEPRANRGANISKLLEKAEKNKDDSSSEDDFWKNNPLFGGKAPMLKDYEKVNK